MLFTDVRWTSAAQTSVAAIGSDGFRSMIPAEPGNMDWDAIVGSGAAILPFVPPVASAPMFPVLSARQFWLAAAAIGLSEADILVAVAGIEDAAERRALEIEVSKTTGFERDHPSVAELAGLMAIPAEQIDSLWFWAAGL